MTQCHHLQLFSGLNLPQPDLGGNLTHLRPRGTPSEPPNNQQYTQIIKVFLCRQIHGLYEVLMTQYHHLQLYCGLSLPQLDLEGESHPLAIQATLSEPQNNQQYAQINIFSLLPNTWLV